MTQDPALHPTVARVTARMDRVRCRTFCAGDHAAPMGARNDGVSNVRQ